MIAPLITLYIGILPLVATVNEYIYYGLPFTILNIISFSWACDYRLSFLWDEVYNTTFCFPALQRLLLVLRNPFTSSSTATRKGVKAETKNYNFHLNWQLLVLFALSVFGIFIHLSGTFLELWSAEQSEFQGKQIMLFFLIYNTLIIGASILSGIDQPLRRAYDRFPLQKACKVYINGEVYDGYTSNLSESGAFLVVKVPRNNTIDNIINQSALIEFNDDNFTIEAKVLRYKIKNKYLEISVNFQNVSLMQNRYLVEILYCNLDWWKQRKKPGFTDSFLAMMTAILTLRPVGYKYK